MIEEKKIPVDILTAQYPPSTVPFMDFPNIDPIAIQIGPLAIRWYALAYLAGFLGAWQYGKILAARWGGRPDKTDIDDFLPWAILGVILGGRIGYVLFYNFAEYIVSPLEALKIWHGGMSFHGGVAGLIAAIVIYSMRRKFSTRRLADIVCAGAPIGLFLGRCTNFVNGELYGRVTDVPWAVKFPAGGFLPRHPSQIYEAILEGFVLFIVLFLLARLKSVTDRPGILTGVFLIGYAAARIFVEFFREPDAQLGFIIEGITMGQILCVPMIFLGAGVMIYAFGNYKAADR
jgi:phosphatidylglycerol:prolipoprotein diacylglycerol transferase